MGFAVAVLALLLLGAAFRFYALDTGLPNVRSRPDEQAILQRAATGSLSDFNREALSYSGAYANACRLWGELVLRGGHLLGLTSGGDYLETFRRQPAVLYEATRSLGATAGVLGVLAIVWVGFRAFGPATALVAGWFVATSFLLVRDSLTFKTDIVTALFTIPALAAIARLAKPHRWSDAMVAGLWIGLALAAKFSAVLLLVPLYLAAVVGSEARGWRRVAPSAAVVGGAVSIALLLVLSPDLLWDERVHTFLRTALVTMFRMLPLSWAPGELEARPFEGEIGTPGLEILWYHLRRSLWHGIGPVATVLALPALVWGLVRRESVGWVCSVFVLVHLVVQSMTPHPYARYMTPLVAPLLLLEAGMLSALASRARRPTLVLAVTAFLVAAPSLFATIGFDRAAARDDTRNLAAEWIEGEVGPGSRIGMLGTVVWPYGEPLVKPPGRIRRLPPDAGPAALGDIDYLVVHTHPLPFSTVEPGVLESLAPHLEPVAVFDPGLRKDGGVFFESRDAYYLPLGGVWGVERPGPTIRIYRVVPDAPA